MKKEDVFVWIKNKCILNRFSLITDINVFFEIVDFQSSQFKFHDFLTQILAHWFTFFDFRKCFKERFSQDFQSRCKVWSGLIICRSLRQRCAISGRAWWIRGFQATSHPVWYDYLLSYASRLGKQHEIFSSQWKLLKRGYKSENE